MTKSNNSASAIETASAKLIKASHEPCENIVEVRDIIVGRAVIPERYGIVFRTPNDATEAVGLGVAFLHGSASARPGCSSEMDAQILIMAGTQWLASQLEHHVNQVFEREEVILAYLMSRGTLDDARLNNIVANVCGSMALFLENQLATAQAS